MAAVNSNTPHNNNSNVKSVEFDYDWNDVNVFISTHNKIFTKIDYNSKSGKLIIGIYHKNKSSHTEDTRNNNNFININKKSVPHYTLTFERDESGDDNIKEKLIKFFNDKVGKHDEIFGEKYHQGANKMKENNNTLTNNNISWWGDMHDYIEELIEKIGELKDKNTPTNAASGGAKYKRKTTKPTKTTKTTKTKTKSTKKIDLKTKTVAQLRKLVLAKGKSIMKRDKSGYNTKDQLIAKLKR